MMNKVLETGRLTKDAKIVKHNGRDSATAYLTVAVQDNFATKGEYLTQFIPMQTYLKSNQIAYFEKLAKGDLVEVEARLKSAVWSKDNEKIHELQVHIEAIRVLVKSKQTTTDNNAEPSNEPNAVDNGMRFDEDDLPF